jgi:signal peptidase I
MQCTSCGFENMPGSDDCCRCGTSLSLQTATAIDVHPPRAGRAKKFIRRAMPTAPRAYYGVRDGLKVAGANSASLGATVAERLTPEMPTLPPRPILFRLVLPGWPQFYAGQRWRGHAFLWGFFAFFVPGVLQLGSTFASFMIGMAFSVHTSGAVDAVNQSLPSPGGFRHQMARSLVITGAIALFVYLPIWWLMSNVGTLRTLQVGAGPFMAGDVVLVNESRHGKDFPRVGDVVMYQLTEDQTEMPNPTHQHTRYYLRVGGDSIDRVLAVGGDHVVWENHRLYVNGLPSELRPLVPSVLPKRLDLRVPLGTVMILPTTTPRLDANAPVSFWQGLACVPIERIGGNVYLRYQPLSRMGFIR